MFRRFKKDPNFEQIARSNMDRLWDVCQTLNEDLDRLQTGTSKELERIDRKLNSLHQTFNYILSEGRYHGIHGESPREETEGDAGDSA